MKKSHFNELMGKGKRCWKYVKTDQDLAHLKEFEDLFNRQIELSSENEVQIPEIIHVVWLGPKDFPEKSKQNLKSWEKFHPRWKVLFWNNETVDTELLGPYKKLYDATDNFGEKSDIVRLIVLDKMGGLYIDHDMECRASFEKLHKTYSFYGGLLTPGNPVIQRSAILRNSIIGAKMGHPILKQALKFAEERWERIGSQYPGKDVTSTKKRVTLRVFSAFHEAVLEAIRQPGFDGIIFPAGYFNEIERAFGLFANEEMSGAWYTEEMTHHEEYLKSRLHKMMKRMYLFTSILAFGILVLFVCVFMLWMMIR